jgi:hypothetical protein
MEETSESVSADERGRHIRLACQTVPDPVIWACREGLEPTPNPEGCPSQQGIQFPWSAVVIRNCKVGKKRPELC